MTMKEIAKLAGVSTSTVSRVLGSPDGSFGTPEVRERIWQIAQENAYTLNKVAQQLRKSDGVNQLKINKGIACIYGKEKSTLLSTLGRYVEFQAMEMNYPLLSSYSLHEINSAEMFHALSGIEVMGAIVIGTPEPVMASLLQRKYKHLVYLGLTKSTYQWDQVICDLYTIACQAIEYLLAVGHKKIGYIGKTSNDLRFVAYKDLLAKHNIDYSECFVQNTNSEPSNCYKAAHSLLEQADGNLPTAVFCANDNTAVAIMKALQENNLRIPEDISIISAQNLEIAQYTTPMLTSVNIPTKQMGVTAVKILVDRIENGKDLAMLVNFPHKIVVRESVKL